MLKMLGGVRLGVWGRTKMSGRRPKMLKMLGGVGFWEFRTFEFGIFDFGVFDLGFWQLGCRPRISNKVSLNVETKKTRRLKLESDLNVRKELGRRKQNADLTLKPKNNMPT